MKGRLMWSIFWATVAVFFIIFLGMFGLFRLSEYIRYIAFTAWGVFTGLGITLIVLTIKQKIAGNLKVFLLLTGASAAGYLVFVALHNLVSALLDTEEPVFFILAAILCPLGFLVGAVGTIIQTYKTSHPGIEVKTL